MTNHATRRSNRKHDNWFYLDKLPPRLRAALCDAAFAWDAKWFYDKWNKGRSVDWCISEIRRADLQSAHADIKWRDGFKWSKCVSPAKETKVRPLYNLGDSQ